MALILKRMTRRFAVAHFTLTLHCLPINSHELKEGIFFFYCSAQQQKAQPYGNKIIIG